ncbi:hypothetical protein C8R45DRAFT_384671 [Mycena sanguinolenta]|nr:hypothetical protein C8R45DRAFT_384671 [Mycena sanguinolenta]
MTGLQLSVAQRPQDSFAYLLICMLGFPPLSSLDTLGSNGPLRPLLRPCKDIFLCFGPKLLRLRSNSIPTCLVTSFPISCFPRLTHLLVCPRLRTQSVSLRSTHKVSTDSRSQNRLAAKSRPWVSGSCEWMYSHTILSGSRLASESILPIFQS